MTLGRCPLSIFCSRGTLPGSRGYFVADLRDHRGRLGPRVAMTFGELLPNPVISLPQWPVRGTHNRKMLFRELGPWFFRDINLGRWRGRLARSYMKRDLN